MMDEQLFKKFVKLIYAETGIALREGKEALLMARIQQRMKILEINSFDEYFDVVINDHRDLERIHFIDVISTNVTYFFREPTHFHFVEKVLQKLKESGSKEIKIWSAACSSGEEPYSISMLVESIFGEQSSRCKILATDISTRMLRRAKEGFYDGSDFEKVPKEFFDKYVSRFLAPCEEGFLVSEELKKNVVFSRINLSKTPFPMKGPFDIIFCRNVMIYFDAIVRRKLVDEMLRLLRPGGLLIVGHSETITDLRGGLVGIKSSIYRKSGGTDGFA